MKYSLQVTFLSPSLGIMDSRSGRLPIMLTLWYRREQENQGTEKHIIVDTLGLSLAVTIHEANLHNGKDTPQAIKTRLQISGTAQTLDCGMLFLMAGKLQKADHRLRIPC